MGIVGQNKQHRLELIDIYSNKLSNKMILSIFLALFGPNNAASAACPKGWDELSGKCYALVEQQETWQDAQAVCLALGGRLAEPRSTAENYLVKGLVAHHNKGHAWLGATDLPMEGTWEWASDLTELGDGGSFTDWKPGQPDDSGNNEDCLEYEAGHGHWNDDNCDEKKPFVCVRIMMGAGDVVIG